MRRKEVPRAGLLKAALAGKITNAEGARAMHVSLRQFYRVKVRFAAAGVDGLLHRLRGRPSPRRLTPEVCARAAELLQGPYGGLNDCHLTEKLREVEGLPLSRSAGRRLRRRLGLPATRRRRGRQVRTRRTPEAQMGALVPLDASPFAWLEDRGPQLSLHGAIDDATGTGLALYFRPAEDLHGYVTLLHLLCTTYGLPLALYGDRLGVFVRNDPHWTLEEELRGTQDPTHFGRILQALGIGDIAAHFPQAKGRIERVWHTLQDRLVSELRLRGIATPEAANAFLPEFLADLNPRFARAPADAAAAWRPAPRDLAAVLSCRYTRTVARDNTVRLGPRWVHSCPGSAPTPAAASTCASAWTAACSSSPTAPVSPRSPPPPTSSFGPIARPARIAAPASAPLSATRPRGPLPPYLPKTPFYASYALGLGCSHAEPHAPVAPQHPLLTPTQGMTFSRNS